MFRRLHSTSRPQGHKSSGIQTSSHNVASPASYSPASSGVQEHREQRKALRVGDKVAILDRYERLSIRTIDKVTAKQITIGWNVYRIEEGAPLGEFRSTRLRGPATAAELDALKNEIAEDKRKQAERAQQQQSKWTKLQELQSLLAPLCDHLACARWSEEIDDRFMIDGLTESSVRLIGEALLKVRGECS